jgi:hypothetical protein
LKEKIDVVAERLHGASGVEYGRAARAIEHYAPVVGPALTGEVWKEEVG